MSSRVRVTESEGRDRMPLSRLESLVKLMSAGRKLCVILGEGEKVVVRRQGLERTGERRRACDMGRDSGEQERRERRVVDEVAVVAREGDDERRVEKLL